MKIASWNIMHGEIVTAAQSQDKSAKELLIGGVQSINPEVIGLQEVDYFHPRSQEINQTAEMAQSLGTTHWAFAPCFYVVGQKQINIDPQESPIITDESPTGAPAYGIAIVSKVPVMQWKRKNLPIAQLGKFMTISREGKLVRIYATDHSRCALAAITQNYILINVHLSFIWPFNRRQYHHLMKWADELSAEYSQPVFVVGDFNLKRIRHSKVWNSLYKGVTFPVWKPLHQIDYVLSNSYSGGIQERHISAVSDHFAISVDFNQDEPG